MDPSRSSRGRLPLPLILAAVVAVIVVPIILVRSNSDRSAGPEHDNGVDVVTGQIRTIPQLSAERKSEVVEQLKAVLQNLYERAFLEGGTAATAPPSPEPTPATRVDDLFTANARKALHKDPDVFRLAGAAASEGKLSVEGVITLEESKPVQALLQVDFVGTGDPRGGKTLRISQKGTLLLSATPDGWRVAGFGLRFESELATPSPSPTPEVP